MDDLEARVEALEILVEILLSQQTPAILERALEEQFPAIQAQNEPNPSLRHYEARLVAAKAFQAARERRQGTSQNPAQPD